MSIEATIVQVSYQPVELCKLLKIANMVGGGGEAKIVISEGYVYVNGEVEFQKRKKIYQNDIIEFNGEAIIVEVQEKTFVAETSTQINVTSKKNSTKKKSSKNAKSSNIKHTDNKQILEEIKPAKRKPISF